MRTRMLDVLFVNADAGRAYQGLNSAFAAIEPPTWALLLAQSCRAAGFGAAILDCRAEGLSVSAAVSRIATLPVRLVCFVVYGQNPNAGTVSMAGATELAAELRVVNPFLPICFVGSHVSALPFEVLSLPFVDFVLLNEGVYALWNLLRALSEADPRFYNVRGIGHKAAGQPFLNEPQPGVPQERMDVDLPGYAWDLLPFRRRPLDLYRAHFWHGEFQGDKCTPFAAIYTSLGCRFKCDFCMINIANRVDNAEGISAADSAGMRYWSAAQSLRQFEILAGMGVETVRISDEMFFLDKRHFEPVIDGLIERGLGAQLRLWSYARVDTVREEYLERFKAAGMRWLALGVEAGNQLVRRDASKGSFGDVNIIKTVQMIQAAELFVIANYIFGLSDDNEATMGETLALALELNTEMANMYPCMALPGSPLFWKMRRQGWTPPKSYESYGFLSYECEPMPTKYLTPAQVLAFRDAAWMTYFTGARYLELVERTFGAGARQNVTEMARVPLRRRLLEEAPRPEEVLA